MRSVAPLDLQCIPILDQEVNLELLRPGAYPVRYVRGADLRIPLSKTQPSRLLQKPTGVSVEEPAFVLIDIYEPSLLAGQAQHTIDQVVAPVVRLHLLNPLLDPLPEVGCVLLSEAADLSRTSIGTILVQRCRANRPYDRAAPRFPCVPPCPFSSP